MKRLTVPTAPSERAKWQTTQPNKRIGWLILTLLLSLGTGFSGALLAHVYQFDLLPNTPDLIVVPENTTSGSAAIIRSLQDQQADALVLLNDTDPIGVGVVLSSDGWIVSAAEIGEHANVTIQTHSGHSYPSDKIVVDEVTGLTYMHVEQDGLRVAQFRNTPVTLGESVVAYSRQATGDSAAFTAVAFTDDHTLTLDRTLPAAFKGAPLYDLDFSIVGFATDTDGVIPIAAVNEVAYGLFTTGEIVRE